mgnify:CR=1 FL=1
MKEAVIQIICAGLGTLGFALFFQVRRQHLLVASLGGALSWLCYLVVRAPSANVFLSALVASAVICLWSEAMARLRKAPANVFLIPGIVPLLPGGALYYAMSGIVSGDLDQFVLKGRETALVAVGIAGGIVIGSEIVRLVMNIQRRRHRRLEARHKPGGQEEN